MKNVVFSLLFINNIPDSMTIGEYIIRISSHRLFFDDSQDATVVVIAVFFTQECENVQ